MSESVGKAPLEGAYGLQHHFDSFEQQRESATLGVWVFLVTEVLFFGALFVVYAVYRSLYPHAFAVASGRLDIVLGTVSTAVLITSSLGMALAVRSSWRYRFTGLVPSRQPRMRCPSSA